MAESLATVLVLAALRGRQHEGAVLDRAGAIKHVPMCFAGLLGERRGDGEKRTSGLGERAIKRGEAQIVADRQSNPPPPQAAPAPPPASRPPRRFPPAGSWATRDTSRRR